jgi:hypothetical protein
MECITAMDNFDAVPLDAHGEPMLVATNEKDYQTYIAWLADYLFRPSEIFGDSLSEQEAGLELIGIEVEIADWIWTHPIDDYPPEDRVPPNGARHADIFHREAMSRTLSRVADRALRIKLIDRFYVELDHDAHK